MTANGQREAWGSRIGLIMAAAGNAVGIGNLLRFPGQAGQHGGGAFMIAYVACLLVFGLPMMWVAWTIGRIGGRHGHGSTPGMFDRMWSSPVAKYLGVLGLVLPLVFVLYYTYIESWCLGYAWFSFTGDFLNTAERTVDLRVYFDEFLGNVPTHAYFPGVNTALNFLLVTLVLNVFVLYRGVSHGIELLAKVAMPLLGLFCLILAVRIFTLGEAPGVRGSAWDGLNFLWTPEFSKLMTPAVWIAAAGQIFFTLSIGFGSLECYGSYVKENDDIALTGLTTAATNEFVEVIFGSLIAIPAAALFFGAAKVPEIAASGTFSIGMISMPEILRSLPGLPFFGTIWFLLLFFAAFTSSVAVAQPLMAFLQDEMRVPRGPSAMLVGLYWLLGTLPVIYFYKYGVLNEMDFWAGTIGLVVMALIEIVLFSWIFGLGRSWEELHRGALLRVPGFFRPVLRFVTPLALAAILFAWLGDAIRSGSLNPRPRLAWGVVERHTYPGRFEMAGNGPDADYAREYEERVFTAVQERRRDLTAWARVELPGDGSVRVVGYEADPRLSAAVGAPELERYLNARGFTYGTGNGNALVPAPATAMLALEALDQEPYIRMVRILIAALVVGFGLIVFGVWRSRAAAAGRTA
jgi:SNF family Na+-dependent transporter